MFVSNPPNVACNSFLLVILFCCILFYFSLLYIFRLSASLKKKLLSCYNLETIAAIQWGVHHETTAIKKYCSLGGQVEETGIFIIIQAIMYSFDQMYMYSLHLLGHKTIRRAYNMCVCLWFNKMWSRISTTVLIL